MLDDATFLFQKEKRKEIKISEASGQVYNVLLQYALYLTKQTNMQRTLLQAGQLSQALVVEAPKGAQNIVRLYEKALKSQRVISGLERETKDPARLI